MTRRSLKIGQMAFICGSGLVTSDFTEHDVLAFVTLTVFHFIRPLIVVVAVRYVLQATHGRLLGVTPPAEPTGLEYR